LAIFLTGISEAHAEHAVMSEVVHDVFYAQGSLFVLNGGIAKAILSNAFDLQLDL
jgi:hypothetical protein